ncbi:glycerophosphodiester phosphodiesterase [Lyngbya confervoides]|uniref:Glycerophosphodiester phosphodiesterase n=1 Tax=Lyngbya confervoides BDU141951 TaxID=1574623 RepID=A0ABD4SZF7_9CYAN|nr:glycerophosphodiester phosphodiesterase [Lyngbya confervoides]MCM1981447.1 glycerophosphodiester phosphodiesterase [Lyngbya confervoides BDU141951]
MRKEEFFSEVQKPYVLGHRGVPEEHQENTMAGFQRAIELGLDGVELDVFLTQDQRLVVFHDINPERLTGVSGDITEMTWPEIQDLTIRRTLDVGDKVIDYGREEKIALLENVLEELRGKLVVDIEIKAYSLDFGQRRTGSEVAHLIRRMSLEKDVFVTSFNLWPLLWLERCYPGIESGFTYSPVFIKNSLLRNLMESSWMGKRVGSTLTNMSLNMFDEDTVERVHEKGLAIGAWTVFSQDSKWLGDKISSDKELQLVQSLTQRGIDYFITDDPVRLKGVLGRS